MMVLPTTKEQEITLEAGYSGLRDLKRMSDKTVYWLCPSCGIIYFDSNFCWKCYCSTEEKQIEKEDS